MMRVWPAGVFLFTVARALAADSIADRIDPSVPVATRNAIIAAVDRLGEFEGDAVTPLHQQIWGPRIDGAAYKQFLLENIGRIVLDPKNCTTFMERLLRRMHILPKGAPAAACVKESDHPGETLWLTADGAVDIELTNTFDILDVILHEARHAAGSPQHARCRGYSSRTPLDFAPKNKNYGSGDWACERGLDGAYSGMAIFFLNIADHCTNCSQEEKKQARVTGLSEFEHLEDARLRKTLQDDLIHSGELALAIENENPDAVIQFGAQAKDGQADYVQLAVTKDPWYMKKLVELGAPLDGVDELGETALLSCSTEVATGNPSTYDYRWELQNLVTLAEAGADVNRRIPVGGTALDQILNGMNNLNKKEAEPALEALLKAGARCGDDVAAGAGVSRITRERVAALAAKMPEAAHALEILNTRP
jgi:hypothetical protein